ncbi:MAG: AAA family ATPase, partial [Firmicutes bacterium]|nr:AAA family ATPase [Bacillota bacterium]
MIAQIDIDNFALFKKARLTFEAGLNVLTGESGSGKSLALEAVVTLFGSRLSPERIGGWGDQFHLRGVVRLGATDPRWAPLTALGIEPDEVLIVERLSGRDGRSLYRAQGELIPASI